MHLRYGPTQKQLSLTERLDDIIRLLSRSQDLVLQPVSEQKLGKARRTNVTG